MSIDLSGIPIADSQMLLIDKGEVQEGEGSSIRVNRLGTRWAMSVKTPAMDMEPDGRRWNAMLLRARRHGALLPICQDGFDVMVPGRPVVSSAVSTGFLFPLSGLTKGYPVRQGQWISLIIGGRRYADQVAVQAIADSSGLVEIELQNPIRRPLSIGVVAELARPMIEGDIKGDFVLDQPLHRFPACSFQITERA